MQCALVASLLLYARLDVAAALAHPRRAGILARVRASPGLTLGDLARGEVVDYKTAVYHARRLARLGLVALVRDGRRVRLFAPGAVRVASPAPRAVVALRLLQEAGAPLGPARLARLLGLPRGTAGSLLEALQRAGLVVRDGAAWRVTARGAEALAGSTGAT